MSRLCICREYEDMFTEGFKYVESLEKHDEQIRADERAKVLDEVLDEVALEEMWLSTAIHEDKGNYEYNIDMAFSCLKSSLRKLKEQKNVCV